MLLSIIISYTIPLLILTYIGTKHLLGFEEIKMNGESKPVPAKLFGAFLITIVFSGNSVLLRLSSRQSERKNVLIEIKDRNKGVYRNLVTDKGRLTIWFNSHEVNEGSLYKMSYLEKSGVILKVEDKK